MNYFFFPLIHFTLGIHTLISIDFKTSWLSTYELEFDNLYLPVKPYFESVKKIISNFYGSFFFNTCLLITPFLGYTHADYLLNSNLPG